jgi:hypothetical protein
VVLCLDWIGTSLPTHVWAAEWEGMKISPQEQTTHVLCIGCHFIRIIEDGLCAHTHVSYSLFGSPFGQL